jgi:hypothetical protein
MYLYENMEKHVPIGETVDAASNLRAQDRMKMLATRPEWVIPGHDAAVFEKFPKVAEGVVRIQWFGCPVLSFHWKGPECDHRHAIVKRTILPVDAQTP